MRVIPKRHVAGGFFDAKLVAQIKKIAQSETDEAYILDDDEWAKLCRGWATQVKDRGRGETVTKVAKRSGMSRLADAYTMAGHALHGAASIAKTSLGIDRASDEQVEARLNACRKCPGGHAVWKEGDVHTCGPMLESMRMSGQGTCGCILHKKARDLDEFCPFGWWSRWKREAVQTAPGE